MRILIRTWTNQAGAAVADDRFLEVERVHIGRGTDQDLQLPDARVALAHAEILRSGRNVLVLAKAGASVTVNGEPLQEHRLRGGDLISVGRYQITVYPAEAGADLRLDVEERPSAQGASGAQIALRPMSLVDAGLSRRGWSWVLFWLVMVSTLVLPAWLRYGNATPPPQPPRATAPTLPALVPTDRLWQPGQSSSAHAFFQRDCARCHETAFRQVADSACLACHKDMAQHVDNPRWLALPAFAQARCTDCHKEHKSDAGLLIRRDSLCTDCHANPQQRFAGSSLPPATSFTAQHPTFTARVARYDAAAMRFNWIEVSQAQAAEQYSDSKLRYPHDKHLDPEGIKSPQGKVLLACGDCHEPDGSGVSFKPIEMQKHCATCHRLDFDPDTPERTVPHGQPAQVAGVIRDFYARAALAGGVTKPGAPAVVQLRRRPGEQLSREGARAALAWADQQSALVIDEVFDKRICGYCHEVRRTGDAVVPFAVAPVALVPHRFTGARFSHADHRTEQCDSCHRGVERSKLASEVLMPDIQRCRDCHGDRTGATHIRSACMECHGYHTAARQKMGAPIVAAAAATPAAGALP